MDLDEANNISDIRLHGSNDKLIIVGSGRVAMFIYKIALLLGYCITVVDNNAETLSRERFSEASELLLGDVVQLLRECAIDETTSIAIVTHHHEYDEPALLAVINSPARYVGVMSNRHAVTNYFSKFESLGITEEHINQVHAPIGLDIGGQLAAEIALAAVAEIQAVKYHRSGGFMITKQSNREVEKRDDLF
ncbi:MAG TPA: XdhC family protein [Syntrophomonadaceae bacterium]|nr:XdhC family protein [Syntrophomonadaceae bacterium]